ncbi:MAG: TatA/E family twin arginine-targeting protein translocase [Cyanobacteria bacterium J06639_1]
MNFFGVGLPEMIVIGAVALLIFGPKRLPEIGRSVAKTIKSLQDASKEFEAEIKREAATLETAVQPSPSTSVNASTTADAPPLSDSETALEPTGEAIAETAPAEASV